MTTPSGTSTTDSPVDPTAITVAPGDTLWSIAKAALPAESTDQEIDTAWRAWYSTNQAVIGDNPDLIAPGQQLLPPPTATESGQRS